ncbi:MAG: hercynine metabolism protein [Synechococcaceae cyanobacterium]
MTASDWFSRLEEQLEQQLESFLRANPDQERLLRRQELLERQQRLRRRRIDLKTSAEQIRADLLHLAGEIGEWQRRVERARAAGAGELAARAELHVAELRARGRDRWQALGELGVAFRQLEAELQASERHQDGAGTGAGGGNGSRAETTVNLDQAWADFEAQQELERMRRNHG